MSEYKQIPGVESRFTEYEIRILIDHFQCKNWGDLTQAAKRYESLFFMFDSDTHGVDMLPGEDMKLILALAEHCVFENFSQTDQPLQLRYREKPKRGRGRMRKEPLPEDFSKRFNEARKVVSTNEDAVQRLKSLGVIPKQAWSLKAKTILRYLQKAEKQKLRLEEEQHRRSLEASEDFKDYVPPPPDELI